MEKIFTGSIQRRNILIFDINNHITSSFEIVLVFQNISKAHHNTCTTLLFDQRKAKLCRMRSITSFKVIIYNPNQKGLLVRTLFRNKVFENKKYPEKLI